MRTAYKADVGAVNRMRGVVMRPARSMTLPKGSGSLSRAGSVSHESSNAFHTIESTPHGSKCVNARVSHARRSPLTSMESRGINSLDLLLGVLGFHPNDHGGQLLSVLLAWPNCASKSYDPFVVLLMHSEASVDGDAVGAVEGCRVDGDAEGAAEGAAEGHDVVGAAVGAAEGHDVVGAAVGACVSA